MFCHKCGAEIPNDSLFCPKCGAKLEPIDKKTETRDLVNASDADQRRSDGAEHTQSDQKDNAAVTEFLSSLINEVPNEPSNEDATGVDGDEPQWWNHPDAEVGHDAKPKHRKGLKWICVAVFVAIAVIFGVFAAVQSYRTLAHDQHVAETSDSGNESRESGDVSDDAIDSASSDETGGAPIGIPSQPMIGSCEIWRHAGVRSIEY